MKKTQGFTLVEVMISLAIFALLVTMAYQSLNLLLESNRRIQQPQADLQQLEWAMLLIGQDLQQLVPRKRNAGYNNYEAALVVPETDNAWGTLLTFTRGGNPDLAWQTRGQMRSHLQRVSYLLENNTLIRKSWNIVDYAENTDPAVVELLTQVKKIQFRFLSQRGKEFTTTWTADADSLPLAVEVTIDHEVFGEIQRIFLVYLS